LFEFLLVLQSWTVTATLLGEALVSLWLTRRELCRVALFDVLGVDRFAVDEVVLRRLAS
jgi:hypothetical protein